MIRSLRWRLMVLTMFLLSTVLIMAMYMFFRTTYSGIEAESLEGLRISGMRYGLHDEHAPQKDGKPDLKDKDGPKDHPDGETPDESKDDHREDDGPKMPIPCFVVGYDHDNVLYAKGTRYYDLTDTAYLESLVQQAQEQGKEHGVLWEQRLRFLKLEDVCGTGYAFTDISNEVNTMVRLMYQYIVIGLCAMVGFFLISIFISRWAVRPVDQVMQQQRRFIADASHELKTPLTVILTNAELLESQEYPPEENRKFTTSILTATQQMRGLVEELLDLARMDSSVGNLQMEAVDLSSLMTDWVLPFEPVYFEAGRTLETQIDSGVQIRGCAHALNKVVEVLLDNGCKYSDLGSTVSLQLTRLGLKKCQITVQSKGETMTKQECRDIFKRFYRADPSRSMNHSYGLGLSIARTVVRQHKGKIWAESKDGINTFHVRLPVGKLK